jgi:preprotein translocase subunit SecE
MARNRRRARDRKLQQPLRENVPGPLDHASGDVDEVEAAIISGADGEPGGLDEESAQNASEALGRPMGRGEDEEEREDDVAPARRGGNRLGQFLRASWAELQRVQWPDRKQVGQATAVVLGFVGIAGAYLGIADTLAQRIVNFII